MTGLCGWIGGKGPSNAGEQLAAMTAGLLEPHDDMTTAVAGKAALAAPAGSLAQDGPLLAAATGHLRWTDRELAALAAREGIAASLIVAWHRHGGDLLDHASGLFSLAVLDGESGQGLIATDRVGSQPIAYAAGGDATVFASSVQAVRACAGVDDSIPLQAVFTYLFFYVMPSPVTLYRGIRKLRPAEALRVGADGAKAALYRETLYQETTDRPLEDLKEGLRTALRAGLGHALEGLPEESLGAFLSGGLDSSTVTALLAERSSRPVKTFTIGFDEPGYDESAYARIVAEAFGTDHHEYYVTPKHVAELIPRLAGAYDEPFGNHSAVPAYYCAKAAREAGVSTMLAGDGGDELFAGNERYVELLRHRWYERLPAALRRGLIEPVSRLPGIGLLPPGRKLKGLVRFANIALPERLYAFDFFAKEALDEVFEPGQQGDIDLDSVLDLVRASYTAPRHGSAVQRLMHMDMNITLADNDLRKVTRMTALAGVDVRYPMLDEAVIDFAASVPESILLPSGALRGFYKAAMQGILPKEVLEKPKHGFGLPFGRWVKTDPTLKEMVDVALRNFRARGLVRESFVDRVMRSHHDPQPTIVDRFAWDIMMFELWLERWHPAGASKAEPDNGRDSVSDVTAHLSAGPRSH